MVINSTGKDIFKPRLGCSFEPAAQISQTCTPKIKHGISILSNLKMAQIPETMCHCGSMWIFVHFFQSPNWAIVEPTSDVAPGHVATRGRWSLQPKRCKRRSRAKPPSWYMAMFNHPCIIYIYIYTLNVHHVHICSWYVYMYIYIYIVYLNITCVYIYIYIYCIYQILYILCKYNNIYYIYCVYLLCI